MRNYSRKKDIIKLTLLSTLIVFVIGVFTYMVTNKLTNTDINNSDQEKMVYNGTDFIDDDLMIVLMKDGVVESEQSLEAFKEENSIFTSITEQFIVNFFETSGYELESIDDARFIFNKKDRESVFEPNKYYIGEKDGFFAIYKSDANGELHIENSNDVFSNSRPVSFLKDEADINKIKNFENSYNTREEALEKISAYIS